MTYKQPGRRDFLKAAATVLTVASFPVVGATPASGAAVSGKRKEDIDHVLRQAVNAREVPGVVAIAATDKGVVYEGAFGTRDLAQGPDMTLDTVFWIASMTKAVTAVAAMQLVEQGKLQLDHLSFLINTQPGPAGRSAGSLAWAGAANTYFWVDPVKQVTGVILMQLRPFADERAVKLYGQFERGVYHALQSA